MDKLNAQEVYDFIEKVELHLFHRKPSAERVDDGLPGAAGEIDFNAKAEAFFRD